MRKKLLSGIILSFWSLIFITPSFAQEGVAKLTPQQAIEIYKRKIAENPKSADLYSDLGTIHLQMGNNTEAAKNYSKAVIYSTGLKQLENRLRLGIALARLGRNEEALEQFKTYLATPGAWEATTERTKPIIYFYLGYVHYYLGNFEEAEKQFQAYVRFVGKSNPVVENFFGLIRTAQEQYEEAIPYYERAIAGSNEFELPLFQYNLGNNLLIMKQWEDSYKLLKESEKRQDVWQTRSPVELANLNYDIAVAAYGTGNFFEAVKYFRPLLYNEYLARPLREQVAVFLGTAGQESVTGTKEWQFVLRNATQYDTNVPYLPGEGPSATRTNVDSVGYSTFFSPRYQTTLKQNLYLNIIPSFYYIYHQDRAQNQEDLFNASLALQFRNYFSSQGINQQVDFTPRFEFPFFNTDSLQLFYQKYGLGTVYYQYWLPKFWTDFFGSFDFYEYSAPPDIPADNLDGFVYTTGPEINFLLFEPEWRFIVGYYFSYANKKGDNFKSRSNAVYANINLPRYGPIQMYASGSVAFNKYPFFTVEPKRQEQRFEGNFNIDYSVNPSTILNARVSYLFNRSKEQPSFQYKKIVYEGALTFIF